MKEYIERAELYEAMNSQDCELSLIDALALIEEFPAADVVEVVRCGECRHAEDSLVLWCTEHEQAVSRLDFCSHGARMDKEDEHEAG